MGNENSVPGADDDEQKKDPPPSAKDVHADFLKKGIDGKTAFENAFEGDGQAMDEINRLVDELEGRVQPEIDKKKQAKLEKEAEARQKQDARKKVADTRKAAGEADDWFEQQVKRGLKEEAAALAAKAARAEEAARVAAAAYPVLQGKTAVEVVVRPMEWEGVPAVVLLDTPLPPSDMPVEPGGDAAVPEAPAEKASGGAKTVPEFYMMLGVGVDATSDEIRRGYRKQALLWHPDKNRNRLEVATERFKKINEAFDTLYDAQKRELYDAGKVLERKAKKLQGHGWSSLTDEDDEVLTKQGWKWKRGAWNAYVFFRGRVDDDDPIVDDPVNDPRVPQEKIKVFWRHMGELAYNKREEFRSENWMADFIAEVWKDTPSRWPSAVELKGMNEASQQEWKERRMVYTRRRQKVYIAIDLHEDYLNIPDRLAKEEKRLSKHSFFRKTYEPLPDDLDQGMRT